VRRCLDAGPSLGSRAGEPMHQFPMTPRLGGIAFMDDVPIIDDVGTIGHLETQGGVLLHQQHRDSLGSLCNRSDASTIQRVPSWVGFFSPQEITQIYE